MEQELPIFEILGTQLGRKSKFKNGEMYGSILGRMVDVALNSLAYNAFEEITKEKENIKATDPKTNKLKSIGF